MSSSLPPEPRAASRYARLVVGAPALVCACVALGTTGYGLARASKTRNFYARQLTVAVSKSETREALICVQRLLDMRGGHAGLYWWWHVLTAEQAPVESEEILNLLAPDTRRGLPKAHLKRAHQIARASKGNVQELERAMLHADRARGPGVPQAHAHAFHAYLAVLVGHKDAKQLVKAAAAKKAPDDSILLLAYAALLGAESDKKAIESLKKAVTPIAKRLVKRRSGLVAGHPYPTPALRQLIEALNILGRHAQSVAMLERAIDDDDAREVRRLKLMLSRAYLQWAGTLPPSRRRSDLLVKALNANPYDHRIMIELLKTTGGDHARLEALMKSYLDDNERMPFEFGTALVAIGRHDDAVPHLEQALTTLGSKDPACANNLAMALIDKRIPDLDRALRLVEGALARKDHPSIRETRARVLLKLGRTTEALRELAAVLPYMGADRHETLMLMSVAYGRMGNRRLALRYREQSEKEYARSRSKKDWNIWGITSPDSD